MPLIFKEYTMDWEYPIRFNGDVIEEVYFNGTRVHGPSSSYTLLKSGGLAPDSNNLENLVSSFRNSYAYAFETEYYDIGPGGTGDSRWRYRLKRGYRMVTSDGTFSPGSLHYLWEGRTVTGANTSHNGGTSVRLERATGV